MEDVRRLVNRRLSTFKLGTRYRSLGTILGTVQGAVTFVLARELDALLLRYPCLYLCNTLQLDRLFGACVRVVSLSSLRSACSTLYKASGNRR